MTFKPGEKYFTRDGREARVYATDGAGEYPLHGAIFMTLSEDFDEGWHDASWTAQGSYIETDDVSDRDLMPPKRELWVNFYTPDRDDSPNYSFWPSREIADKWAGERRIARVRIEFQEGQFDE